ncbi:hypothetical protein HNS38_08770 [Lentimicrobium sp. L6]|uniref:DUF4175 family protein n=1 Tax=Lentimicrobium sp. L6 TaxID=2735916 RepID=UPI001556AF82|nr:DUF4175 family protein [Lentimicrobium sp. L6]NPD84848.1 hypothetical protein [Lentimicrobium sp. L6]
MSINNYEIIIKKLDAFINKYYKNLIIKGFLYLFLISLSIFIILAVSEYFLHFSVQTRTILVYSYLLIFIGVFVYFVLLPALALLRIYRHINYQDASKIIGKHFPEIRDKLSNVLQLQELGNIDKNQRLLIEAGISQKAEKIKPFPLLKAVDFRSNLKYGKYLLIPLTIILFTWLIQPKYVEEPTKRLVQYEQEFERQWPFKIEIVNEELSAFQKEDFELKVQIIGEEWPDRLFINYQNSRYLFTKKSGNVFVYTFKNLRNSIDFYISDAYEFQTKNYQLEVFPKAVFNHLEIKIFPPAYTQLPNRVEKNINDLRVPVGSVLQYHIKTAHSDSLLFIQNTVFHKYQVEDNLFIISDTIDETKNYRLYSSNQYLDKSDSLSWLVQMLPDEYPRIQVETVEDSLNTKLLYFNGMIDDDYGFSSLSLYIEKGEEKIRQNVSINANTKPQRFYFYLDLEEVNQEKGLDITYYFSVSDNDRWNGPKSARSQKQVYHFDSQDELIEKRNQNSDSLKNELSNNLEEWKDLQNRIKDFKKELIDKELMSWEDRKKMEDLLKEQEELQKKIEDFQKQSKDISEQNEDLEKNQRILDKQEQLQELFEQVMDEETKKKMEELRKMLEEMNKENSQELLDQMELNSEDLEEQLDRNLELFKQLEFEMRMEESIEELKKLSEEQKKLAEETKDSKKDDADKLQQKQDSINNAFEDIKKELSKLDSLNKSLEEPNSLDMKKEEQAKIDSLQQEAQEQLEDKKMDDASEKQEEAAEEMKEMAEGMQMEMEANAMEEMGEDMETLREILDQLIKLSFTQEDIMDTLLAMEDMDPSYNGLVRRQFGMESKLQGVRDSLSALAKRQPAVQPFILKEFNKIDYRLQSTTDFLEAHQVDQALKDQQFIMTSFNQLALMLSEAMEQMEQMMNSMMKGNSSGKSKSCPKPGSGNPSAKSMKQMQQQLNNQMKEMQKQMKDGKKPGKKGDKGKQGQGQGMSEQFARMAAEQAKIRRMMEDYQNQMMEETGGKPSGLDGLLKEMEETEKDLVNKMISQETLKRQQNIMTRLLKSEKAERQREKEQERKSDEGKNIKRSNPKEFLKYKEIKEKDLNLMKTIPLDFNQYYKKKVDEYFYKFDNTDDDDVEK